PRASSTTRTTAPSSSSSCARRRPVTRSRPPARSCVRTSPGSSRTTTTPRAAPPADPSRTPAAATLRADPDRGRPPTSPVGAPPVVVRDGCGSPAEVTPAGRALLPRAGGGDPTGVQDDHPVGLLEGGPLRGGADDGSAALAQRVPELDLGRGVERAGDVIGQEQLRLRGQRPREG